MAVDDGREGAGQIAVWLDLVQFAGFNEGREHCPVLRASLVTCEERVFSLQGDGTDCALDGIAVHLDAAIAEEQDQPVPIFGDVFEGFACWGFGGYL